jgi:hypothetical protein
MALGVVLLTVLVSGAAAGLWNGRWGESPTVQRAAARLDRLPLSLGSNWDVEETTLSAREVAVAAIEGYASRRYLNRRTGMILSVLLLCGQSGPMSVHTPDVCFAGAGYAPIGTQRLYEGPSGSHSEFRVCDFKKENVATPTLLRVFLSWGSKEEWTVPARPRLAFAGKPYLYKLYVSREMARPNEPINEDPATELIKELLPQLQETLWTGS